MSNLDRKPTDVGSLPPSLRADCSRCVGLCCVTDAFFAVQGFAYDKPAGTACRHLTAGNRCAIHAVRASRGFGACAGFDCHGAGQRVTRNLRLGANWHDSRETAARAFAAYSRFAVLHRLMAMLALAEGAAGLPLRVRMREHRAELEELCRTEEAMLGTIDVVSVQARIAHILREVRNYIAWREELRRVGDA